MLDLSLASKAGSFSVILEITAVTTNTRPQRVFYLVQTCGLVDVNQPLPWFSRVGQEEILSCFSSTQRNRSAFNPFLQYFATVSDTTSCQDYEEYEFVECLSEETQIIDLFTVAHICQHNKQFLKHKIFLEHNKLFSKCYTVLLKHNTTFMKQSSPDYVMQNLLLYKT